MAPARPVGVDAPVAFFPTRLYFPPAKKVKMVREWTVVDTLGGADALRSPHPLFHAEQNDRDRHRRPAQHR